MKRKLSRILKLKNKMNMKNLIKYGFIAVVSCFWSCGDRNEIIKQNRQSATSSWSTIEYDGCEYLIGSKKGMHKGNCKNPIHKCNCR